MLRQVHPILAVADVDKAIAFYTERLGFQLGFRDPSDPKHYVGVRRDGVELHFQWQDAECMANSSSHQLRFLVEDPDALFEEFQKLSALPSHVKVEDKPWGTREFAFYDPNRHALTFYRDL